MVHHARRRAAGAERVIVERRPPDFDALRRARRGSFVTPRNVVYTDGDRQVVDYFGKALCVVDRRAGTATVQGEDAHLVHEAAYLYLLSRVGEHLDRRGLTRLHALALSGAHGRRGGDAALRRRQEHAGAARAARRARAASSRRTRRCSIAAACCTRSRCGSA